MRGSAGLEARERRGGWRRGIGIALCASLIAAGLLWQLRSGLRADSLKLPFEPPTLPASLAPVDRVPWPHGALRGASVLLVTLDTVRPDRLGLYGNTSIETPVFDRLGREGVVFAHALATAPLTLPAHASILTGLHPLHHGARSNGLHPLPERAATLAERLRAAGRATGAFVSSFVLDARFGLARGFDVYDDATGEAAAGVDAPERDPERRGDHTVTRALAWLERAPRPFFAWVHLYDPHAPYTAPARFAEQAANAYDAEIAFSDAQLGRLLAALAQEPAPLLIVVLADHGEALGERAEATHGYLLHQATLQIPLVLSARGLPEPLPAGLQVVRPVSQVDLLPTLLALLDVPAPDGLDGIDLTAPIPPERLLTSEALLGLLEYGWAPIASALRGEFKYVHGPPPELYDLARDPRERENLAAADPSRAAALRRQLERFYGGDLARGLEPGAAASLTAEEAAQLAALGYRVGDAPPQPPGARPPPAELLPVLNEVQRLVHADAARLGPEVVIARLERLAARHPDFVVPQRYLARALRDAGRLDAAERAMARAVALSGEAPTLVQEQIALLVQLGRLDEARGLAERLAARHPRQAELRRSLGALHLAAGDAAAAAVEFEAAFALDPRDSEIVAGLAMALRAAGEPERLRRLLEQALDRAPGLDAVRRTLAAPPIRGTATGAGGEPGARH